MKATLEKQEAGRQAGPLLGVGSSSDPTRPTDDSNKWELPFLWCPASPPVLTDQHHQHHLGTCWKGRFSAPPPTPDPLNKIVFGSVARGDDTEESDIDILIIIQSDNHQFESMVDEKVVDFILEKEEVISPHVMTVDHFNKTKDYSFLKTVMAEGVDI